MPRCGLCDRPLRDRQSIELGFGPRCWSRLSALAEASAPGPPVAGERPRDAGHDPAPSPPPRAGAPDVGGPAATPVGHGAAGGGGHRGGDPPLLVGLGWLLALGAVLVLLEYWRWVLLGVLALTAVSATGLVVERVAARRADRSATGPPR